MRWPTDAAGMSLGPVNNPVLTAGLSLLEHMLQSDAVVSWFRYQCLPVPPSEPPSLLEIEDMEDIIAAPGGPQLLTGPQIRAQIAANWPILGVSNATHPEDWQGMSRLQTNGPVTILIASNLFRVMCSPKNDGSRRSCMSLCLCDHATGPFVCKSLFRAMCSPKNDTEAVVLACHFAFVIMQLDHLFARASFLPCAHQKMTRKPSFVHVTLPLRSCMN
ncbi:hypothetical protein BDZ88DRAFT_32769 [Geranomyces variabilis]|nr:hypothetical protein BDZ88DRAFT_32769 [Geranomyces variabilis]